MKTKNNVNTGGKRGKKSAEEIAMKIGSAIRSHRKSKGLTLMDLEIKCGVKSKLISKIEKRGDGKFINFIRVTKSLGLAPLLKSLVPDHLLDE